MKNFLIIALISLIAMSSCKQKPITVKYPETKKVNHTDVYFGTEVADPYRWLEDDRSEETAEWVKAENKITFDYLDKIPYRNAIKEELTKIWNYPKEGVPFKVGEKYFAYKNDGLQNQSVLYVMDGLHGEPHVFLDPNAMSKEGTTSIGSISPSVDNKYIAYTISSGGSDWREIRVKDMDGNDLPDVIKWVKFSGISWRNDGFYYSCYDAPKGSALSEQNQDNKIYYHKLSTPQEEDQLVYSNPENPLRYNTAYATEDGRFLILDIAEGTDGNMLLVKSLKKANADFIPLVNNFEYNYSIIENFDDDIYILTNQDAPRYKLVKVNINSGKPKWETVIPESNDVLNGTAVIGDKIVARYMHNAHSKLHIYDKNGKMETEIALPEIGSVSGISGKKADNEMFYAFSSFATPTTIYRINDINNPVSELYKETELSIKPSKYITEQVFFESKDGTKVPMFIVYKEGTTRNGQNPTLLYGYGGFNSSVTPGFSISNMLFLENGGIYVVANIRGGGEFGSEWHKAGTKLQKQNVFDDFIAAAEHLIREKYTSASKLAIRGGSNGGLLVGACITQRPELFKVALPAVGVMDMLRFHKFTVGWGWISDYGSSDNEEEFPYLLSYSPLHNIKEGVCYPATLVTTADHDDRVVPAHSFKFTATMQAAQACDNPILIRIETMAGHGAGKSTAKTIEENADMWSFVFYNLGMDFKK